MASASPGDPLRAGQDDDDDDDDGREEFVEDPETA